MDEKNNYDTILDSHSQNYEKRKRPLTSEETAELLRGEVTPIPEKYRPVLALLNLIRRIER